MPVWPEEGSVKDCGEYIIVKLSEDKWARGIGTIEKERQYRGKFK